MTRRLDSVRAIVRTRVDRQSSALRIRRGYALISELTDNGRFESRITRTPDGGLDNLPSSRIASCADS